MSVSKKRFTFLDCAICAFMTLHDGPIQLISVQLEYDYLPIIKV